MVYKSTLRNSSLVIMYQLLVITLTEKATWQLHISHERLALTGPDLLASLSYKYSDYFNLDPGENDFIPVFSSHKIRVALKLLWANDLAMKAKMCNSPLPKQKHPCFDSCPVSEKQNIHTPLLLHIFHTNLCMYNIYIYFLNMLHIKKDYGTLQNTCLTKIITPQMFENYTKPLHNVTLLN